MRDSFKKLVQEQKEEFEYPFDAEAGWRNFEQRYPKKSGRQVYWFVAASVALLLGVGIVFVSGNQSTNELSEWEEVELFYQSQINEMTVMLASMTDDRELLNDLEMMDQAFAELKADLKDDVHNEEVVEAMMNHYRLKVRILEKMLEEMKEENEQNESISFI